MAKKRSEIKENIFVTNEYFEKFGVSRQVVEYQRTSGKIESIGMYKGMNLYFKTDADFLIIRYWMNNFKAFVADWELAQKFKAAITSQIDHKIKKVENNPNSLKAIENQFKEEPLEKLSISLEEYYELMELFKQYRISRNEINTLDKRKFHERFDIHSEINQFLHRICAYKESNLSFFRYKRKEKAKIASGMNYYQLYEYFLIKNGKKPNLIEAIIIEHDLLETLSNDFASYKQSIKNDV